MDSEMDTEMDSETAGGILGIRTALVVASSFLPDV